MATDAQMELFLRVHDAEVRQLRGTIDRLRSDLDRLNGAGARAGRGLDQTSRAAAGAGASFGNLRRQMLAVVGMTGGIYALHRGVRSVARAAIDFESAFAGIRKTVDASEAEFGRLEKGIRGMAKEIPIAATELSRIGELGGQLGIDTSQLLRFTRVIADLGVTTNLSTEEAATSLARLANVMRLPEAQIGRVGAAIVALGNNFATTEQEIVAMANRLTGAASVVGVTTPQVLGIATALRSVGVEAEAGGTAFSRAFIKIAAEVEKGGEKLDGFARVAGMSTRAFADLFRRDAASALVAFIRGLDQVRRSGGDVFGTLEALSLTETRLREALLKSASAGDLLTDAIDTSNRAWQENRALTEEAAKRYDTTASKLQVLQNNVTELKLVLAEEMLPVLVEASEELRRFIDTEDTREAIRGLGGDLREIAAFMAEVVRHANAVAQSLGGWETVFKIALAGWVVTRLAKIAAGFSKVMGVAGGSGALGAAGALQLFRSRLMLLMRGSPYLITVSLALDKELRKDFQESKLGRWINDFMVQLDELYARIGIPGTGSGASAAQARSDRAGGTFTAASGFTGASDALTGGVTLIGNAKAQPPKAHVVAFVKRVAGIYGAPLTIVSGTRPGSRVKGTGSPSQHGTGDAADIGPYSGATLTRIGQAALVAAGMPAAQAYKQQSFVGTVNGVNILFNTWVGGNHFDHVHVGLTRLPAAASAERPKRVAPYTDAGPDAVDRAVGNQAAASQRRQRGIGGGAGKATIELPNRIQNMLAQARLTPKNLRDDLAAVNAAIQFFDQQRAKVKKGSKAETDLLNELGEWLERREALLGQLERKSEKAKKSRTAKTRESELLPVAIREALAQAELTPGAADNLKALRDAEAFLRKALAGAKGERRISLLRELVSVRREMEQIRKASKDAFGEATRKAAEAADAVREIAAAAAAAGVDLQDALDFARLLPADALVEVRNRFGQLTELFRVDEIVKKVELLRAALAEAASVEDVRRITEELQRWGDLLLQAAEQVRDALAQARDQLGDSFGEIVERALRTFDARTDQLVSGIADTFGRLEEATRSRFDGMREAVDENLAAALAAIDEFRRALTPAEAEIRRITSERDQQRFAENLAAAQETLAAAQDRLAVIESRGASPRALREQQKVVADAQRAVDDLLLDQQLRTLEEQAEVERSARDAEAERRRRAADDEAEARRRELERLLQIELDALRRQREHQELELRAQRDEERRHFQRRLEQLNAALLTGELDTQTALERMNALFGEFGVDFAASGAMLGTAFAAGFTAILNDFFDRFLPDYLAKKASVDSLTGGGAGGGSVVVEYEPRPGHSRAVIGRPIPFAHGGIVTRPTLGLVGEAGPEAIIPLDRFDGLGGDLHVHVHAGTVVGGDLDRVAEELAPKIRRKLNQHGRRGADLWGTR